MTANQWTILVPYSNVRTSYERRYKCDNLHNCGDIVPGIPVYLSQPIGSVGTNDGVCADEIERDRGNLIAENGKSFQVVAVGRTTGVVRNVGILSPRHSVPQVEIEIVAEYSGNNSVEAMNILAQV